MEEKRISIDKVALWIGEKEINLKLAYEQIDILTKENLRLSGLLSTCKCERKDEKDTG